MKKVLIIGAGHVTKPIVDYFIDTCGYQVTMAARTVSKAERIIANRSLGIPVSWASDQEELLDRLISENDIVVNMIPKAHHVMVTKLCLKHRKDMVTTSYEIPPVKAFDEEAKQRDVLILNELGEDPGMDHFGTQMLLDEIQADGGKVISLHSYGTGLPSFKYNNNPMGYKFSWEPKGVFLAAQVPAVYLKEGKKIPIPGDKLFDNHWLVNIEGLGTFETYANKDCTRYLKHFGLEENITLYRGLLRFSGYCNNMRNFIALGLLNDEDKYDFKGQTYRQFASSLVNGDPGENVEHEIAGYLKVDDNADIINRLRWIGIFKDQPISIEKGSKLDVLVDLMLKKMSYAPGETDMIIVHIEIIAEFPDNHREKRMATMLVDGIPNGDSAMSRAVGLPPAIAARLILEGRIIASGVHMPPTLPELYRPILEELATYGFEFRRRMVRL
ncbi:MAG: saccharopine dehydrogenase NADP-binding domain-containing protein [candidate division Zixibacteria bacterium]|nr:saccharopine dehydrogenase NADP-binding domain-containing protein [Candidatus Tariuqbacter arcticus]